MLFYPLLLRLHCLYSWLRSNICCNYRILARLLLIFIPSYLCCSHILIAIFLWQIFFFLIGNNPWMCLLFCSGSIGVNLLLFLFSSYCLIGYGHNFVSCPFTLFLRRRLLRDLINLLIKFDLWLFFELGWVFRIIELILISLIGIVFIGCIDDHNILEISWLVSC